jgi:histidine triad (HIT) family protein
MTDCLFCNLLKQNEILKETENLFVLEDLYPKAPIHLLIIPKKHIPTLDDFSNSDSGLLSEMLVLAKKLGEEYDLSEDGYRLVWNVKSHGGQEVYHSHLHLLGGKKLLQI